MVKNLHANVRGFLAGSCMRVCVCVSYLLMHNVCVSYLLMHTCMDVRGFLAGACTCVFLYMYLCVCIICTYGYLHRAVHGC